MREYIVRYTVDSKTLESRVRASSPNDAKQEVKNRYPGKRVVIVNCKDTTTGWMC